jgi:hypothetical protein
MATIKYTDMSQQKLTQRLAVFETLTISIKGTPLEKLDTVNPNKKLKITSNLRDSIKSKV